MSHTSRVMLGALALSLTFGAIQFAVGRDLTSGSANANETVNRGAKSDRAPLAANGARQDQTLSFQLRDMSDSSVLVRIPTTRVSSETISSAAKQPTIAKNAPGAAVYKASIACEPVVSVLTEVAKRLQPGRCLT